MSERMFSATSWRAITPSDTGRLEPYPVAVVAAVDGNIAAVGADGVSAVFGVLAGQMLSIQPRQILATGTTATGLIALYN